MKQIIQLAFLLLLIAHISYAQTAFGLKAGINVTNLSVSDPQATYNSRTGYHAGFFVREKFGKIAVQPELLLFTQKNTIDNYQGLYTVTQSFTYLSLPLMVKFYPIWGLNIQLGPQFGLLLDGERKTDSSLASSTEDIKNYYKKGDVSMQDINNVSSGENAKSQVFLLSIGWNFLK